MMFMKNVDLIEKVVGFAKSGKGRRLLNTLNKRDNVLTSSELDEVLRIYCEIGLPKEVEMLKIRRGILSDEHYNFLAEKVKGHCCSVQYDDFAISLRTLLRSGMTMNPTKADDVLK